MKKTLIIHIISILCLNSLSAQQYHQVQNTRQYITDANRAALEWWNQVDNKQYEKAYSALSEVIRDEATLEDWLNQISILMDEIGSLKSRTVKDTHFQSKLEGHEDGFYVEIEYDANYSKPRNHTEYLLLKQSDQFKWEIISYVWNFGNLKEKR